MPTMLRLKGKAKKIAYHILGKPANIAVKMDKAEKKINKRLIFEETIRVR